MILKIENCCCLSVSAKFRKIAKIPGATLQTLQDSFSMLNFKVHDSIIR